MSGTQVDRIRQQPFKVQFPKDVERNLPAQYRSSKTTGRHQDMVSNGQMMPTWPRTAVQPGTTSSGTPHFSGVMLTAPEMTKLINLLAK